MEEAEALCDRLGIFVNGELQCIGNAKEVPNLFVKHYLIEVCFVRFCVDVHRAELTQLKGVAVFIKYLHKYF